MVDAFIPESYIESTILRIDAYRKIAAIMTEEDSQDVIDEFIDRYGEPPKPVMGLINIALVRNSAASAGVKEITQRGEKAIFSMRELSPETAAKLFDRYKNRLKFIQGAKPGFSIDISAKQQTSELVKEVVAVIKS